MQAVRTSKNELAKLIKRINPLFKTLRAKKPRTAAVARKTQHQNQWITSVNNWLSKLKQTDESASGLTITATDRPITLKLSERKPIINTLSNLLKDLTQQNKKIHKANRDKQKAEGVNLRAKKVRNNEVYIG